MATAKGWRTLGVAVAISVVGALQTFNWVSVIPAGDTQVVGLITLALGFVMGYLRTITDTPVGVSTPPAPPAPPAAK